jgi:hypothetical protein
MRTGLWAVLFVACGAKSGLDVDVARRADAGPGRPFDSGLIVFPCRWAPLGIDVEMLRSVSPITDIAGYIHPDRAEIVARAAARGVFADIGPRPAVLRTVALAPELRGVAARGGTYVFANDCAVEWRDADFRPLGFTRIAADRCAASASTVPGALDIVRSGESQTDVWRASADAVGEDAVRVFGPVPVRSRTGLAVEAPLGMVVVLEQDGELWVHHRGDGAIESLGPIGAAEPFGLAPDAVVGGAMLVRQGRIDRIESQPLRIERVRDLGGLRIASRTIAWSSSEVVFVLDDGSLAFMPFFGSDLRIEPGAVPAPFGEAEVVLRNGGTEGGILYTVEEGGEFVLFYRPLVCNR